MTRSRSSGRTSRDPDAGRRFPGADYEREEYGRADGGRGDYGRGDYGRGEYGRGEPGRRPGGPGGPGKGGPDGGPGGPIQFNVSTLAVLAGVLVVGIGIGSAVTSTTQGNQGNIASSQQLDMAVPDPEFCKQWGASAFVMDVEMYTTMNPSSSFVTQPTLQPGCVIRRENWAVLQKEGAVTSEQMRECKQRMNTFAYIGSIRDKPVVRCVYQTDITGNKFQTRGVAGAADDSVGVTPESDQF
ncbi:MAG: DUF3172 domain-containing protein [Cyanobacteriota bacterium]